MANLSILHIGNVPKDDRGELFEGLKYASGIRELATDYKAKDNTSLASFLKTNTSLNKLTLLYL
jgi:hypothetical protein